MTPAGVDRFSTGKKVLRVAASAAAVMGAVLIGILYEPQIRAQSAQTAEAPPPSFEVASIKPDQSGDVRANLETRPTGLSAQGVTTKHLIAYAYGMSDYQISGGPGWVGSDRYRIEAKVEDSLAERLRKLPLNQQTGPIPLMIQSLLAERFQLKVSHATKEGPVLALVIAKTRPKLQETKPGNLYPPEPESRKAHAKEGLVVWRDRGVSMANFATQLSRYLGRTVLDRTGIDGRYDFWLEFAPDRTQPAMSAASETARPEFDDDARTDASGPSIFTAIREQLGLKLESAKGPVEVVVIDHIERPSEN